MKLIPRRIQKEIEDRLRVGDKGVVIYGARQVGKTTLVRQIVENLGFKTLIVNGDKNEYADVFSSRDLKKISGVIAGYEMLLIDEAQRIPEIGINLKIILDEMPRMRVLVTGSSALDLASKIAEPLTGRIWVYRLYPVSAMELNALANDYEINSQLEQRLVFGSYPEVFKYAGNEQKTEYLDTVGSAYLYKDLLEFGGLKSSGKIRNMLKLLAFQVGSLVSLTEIGNSLEMSKETVDRYIDYLEKSFVVFRLPGFSRNLRKEIAKMDKIYFYDTGIRNAMISNFKMLADRDDSGRLWENFLMAERIKRNEYLRQKAELYYWRTYAGTEIDLVEEKGGELFGYEFKWGEKKGRVPESWLKTYKRAKFEVINRSNWLGWVR